MKIEVEQNEFFHDFFEFMVKLREFGYGVRVLNILIGEDGFYSNFEHGYPNRTSQENLVYVESV